jgi:osmotically-inducible protein OsmY
MNDLLRRLFGIRNERKAPQEQQPATATSDCKGGNSEASEPQYVIRYSVVVAPEQKLLSDVLHSLACCPDLQSERFNVFVHDSVVTLNGTISTHQRARMAWRMAIETPGVKSVINDLHVLERN